MGKPSVHVLGALALLSGGHCRSLEIIIDSATTCLQDDKKCTLNAIISAAKMKFSLSYHFASAVGLNEAVLMALFNRPVTFKKKFIEQGDGLQISVEDLVENGLLMDTALNAKDARIVDSINLPLLALFGWSFFMDHQRAPEDATTCLSGAISDELLNILRTAQNHPSHEAFELIFPRYLVLLREVYKAVSDRCASLPLPLIERCANINWRCASIVEMFPHCWGTMQLSDTVNNARFDLTQTLKPKTFSREGRASSTTGATFAPFSSSSSAISTAATVLRGLRNIDSMSDEEFDELTSTVYSPNYCEAPGLYHFMVLKDVKAFEEGKRHVVVVAIENKFSKEESSTVVNIENDVYAKRCKASELLSLVEQEGKVSFLFVLAAWRDIRKSTVHLKENCMILAKNELSRVFGNTLVDLMLFIEHVESGLEVTTQSHDA
jgi:hypothetical protein